MMIAGAGIPLGLRGKNTNALSLQAGMSFIIPAGRYLVGLGLYTSLQFLDPVTNIWRNNGAVGPGGGPPVIVESDGANWRLANTTGCAVGATITTANATGCTTGIGTTAVGTTVTPSTGGSVWVPIVGGALPSGLGISTPRRRSSARRRPGGFRQPPTSPAFRPPVRFWRPR